MTLYKWGSNQYKKTRIYHNGKIISRFNADGRRYTFLQKMDMFMIKWIKRTAIIAFMLGLATGSLKVGQATTAPKLVKADTIIKEVKIPIMFNDIPLLQKICKAESGNRQFNKDGSILRGVVNKSDLGFCQINETINNDLARKLGYDIYTEQGNKDFAVYLYLTRGSQPWDASKPNWSKM